MTTLIAILIIFLMLSGWVVVQQTTRRFAARHPEFGPAREEGSGCGFLCHHSHRCAFRSAGICTDSAPTLSNVPDDSINQEEKL